MVRVIFEHCDNYKEAEESIYQWNYGEKLEIHGLSLPAAVEIHFSFTGRKGDATRRIGITKDRVTTVAIPEEMLEQPEDIKAYVYVSNKEMGRTEKIIKIPMIARPKPEAWDKPEDAEVFRDAIDAVNGSADRAESAETSAEAWAHGHAAHPDRDEDNARFYARQVRDMIQEIPGEVEGAKKDIDAYTTEKKAELKGDTGDVSFASFAVVPPKLYMFNNPNKTHIEFTREGSRLFYRPHFPEREM